MTIKLTLLACVAGLLLSQSAPGTRGAVTPAETARREAIQASIAALENECRTYGGGNWNAWFDQLAPFRAELRSKMDASYLKKQPYLLEMDGLPTQFELTFDVGHLAQDVTLDSWIEQRAVIPTVIAVSRWLRKQNIDVIFVSVPRLGSIYPDRLVKSVPADKIVAPQVKKLQLELLKADVEVIDLLPGLLAAREKNPESLTFPDEWHWGPGAQDVAARLVTERLARYPFVQRAMAKPPLYHAKPVARSVTGTMRQYFTLEQVQKLVNAPKVSGTQILDAQNRAFQPVESSPVVLMSDSFGTSMNAYFAEASAFDAQISQGINMPITTWMTFGNTVQRIKDLVRDPEMLKERKVIIWLVQEPAVCNAKFWSLPDLPEPPAGR